MWPAAGRAAGRGGRRAGRVAGRPARARFKQSVLSGGCGCEAAASVLLPHATAHGRHARFRARADPSPVRPVRQQPPWARGVRLHQCLLPPSAPRHRAPSAPGTCRRRWLGRGRRTCPSRSTTRTCPTPRTTAAVPPRRHRRSCLTSPPGGGTTSWPRTRTVLLRRLQATLPGEGGR